MVARADILAGRAVILVNIQDTIDKQLRGIRSKMRMFTSGISEMGGDLFRGGVASTIAAAFPVKEFVSFQDQMLFLQTKVQATDAQMKPLEHTIRQLGMTTSFSSQEVGKAATMYAQAGFSIVEIQNSLQAALDLSRGSQVDLTTSTTILSNALRTFQKDTSNAAMFASKFVTAARLGTLDIVDLGESLKYSAGTFANFGLELDDVLGMITTLANSGLKASLAGTSLNTAFLNLASTAPKLKELLNVELLEADFKNPIQALRKLEAGLSKFSKIEQAGILQDLVNIRGGRAIQGLLLQGLDKLDANIQVIKGSMDESRTSALKLDSALGGVGRRALSAFQELNIAIGATTEGPLSKFGERLAAVFNNLSRLAVANQKTTQTLLLMAPAALAAGVGLLVMTSVVGKLAMLITPLMMLNSTLFSIGAGIVGVNVKQISGVLDLIKRGGIGVRTGLAGSFLHSQLNAASLLAPVLQRIQNLLLGIVRLSDRFQGSPFRIPSMAGIGAGSNRGFRGSYGFDGMAGPALGFNPRVFAPTAAQNIPDAPAAAAVTKALNRTAGLILRPFQDLPEAQTKQAAKGFARIGRTFVATFQTRLNAPIRGFLNNFGKGITTQVFRGFTIVAQSPKLLTDNRRGLIKTGVTGGLTKTAAQGLSEAVRTWTRSQARISTTLPRLLTDQRRPTQLPRLTSSQRLLGGPGAIGAGGQIIEGRVRAGGAIGAARQTGRGVSQELSRAGKAGAALRKVILGTVNAIRTGFGATAAGAIRVATAAFGGFRTVLTAVGQAIRGVANFVVGTNWLGAFITGARGVATVFGGMLSILSKLRTVLFSLSGWLLIAEFLILFGDKIPVISDLLEKMGNAFSNLFSNIGNTLKNLGPSFGLLGRGLNDIFGGKAERGIIRIKDALLDMGNIIKTGLSAAWAKFLEDMQPITDRVSQFVKGLIDIFNLLITAIGSVFGTIGDTIGSQLGSGGSALDAAKTATSPENISSVFAIIGGAVVEIAKILMDILAAILSVNEVFNKGMGALIRWFSTTAVKDSQRNYWEAVASGFEMQGQIAGAKVADLKSGRTSALEEAFNSFMESISPPEKTALEEMTDALFPEADFKAGLAEQAAAEAAERAALAANWDTMEDFFKNDTLQSGLQAISDFFGKYKAQEMAAAVAPQAAQLAPMATSIGKAIVGDFESSRGNLMQMVPRMEKLQEKANQHLEDIDEGLANLNDRKNPFVFMA